MPIGGKCVIMGSLFMKQSNSRNISQRELLTSKYHSGRHNLLLVVVFTVVNLVLLLTNSGSYFLFSAYIPYFLGDLGMDLCGKYPAEYYEMYHGDVESIEFYDTSLLAVLVAIAAVITGLYLLCWFLAKKPRVGFLVFALVLFAIDTAFMLMIFGINFEMILDIVFHAWVIISLVNAIISYHKIKKLPAEAEETIEVAEDAASAPAFASLNGDKTE